MKKKILSVILIIMLLVISSFIPNGNTDVSAKTKYSEKVTLYVGQKISLYYTVNFKKVNSKKVKWKSYNKKIATVSKKGIVKAKKKGKTKIRAKYGKSVLYAKVTVKSLPKSYTNNSGTVFNNNFGTIPSASVPFTSQTPSNVPDTNTNILTNTQLAANLLINMQPLKDGSILFSVTNNNSQMVSSYSINYQAKNAAGAVIDTGRAGGYVLQPGRMQYCYAYVGKDKAADIDINQSVCSVTVNNYDCTDETSNVSVSYDITSDNNIAFTYYNAKSVKNTSITSVILYYDEAGQIAGADSNHVYLSPGETKFTTVYIPYGYDDNFNHIPLYASYQVFYYAY